MIGCQCLITCFQLWMRLRRSCNYIFRPSMDRYLIKQLDFFDWMLCLFLGKFDINQNAVINSYNTCSREHWAKAQKSAIYEKFEEIAKISLSCCFDSLPFRVVCKQDFELFILLKGAIWGCAGKAIREAQFPRHTLLYCSVLVHWCVLKSLYICIDPNV